MAKRQTLATTKIVTGCLIGLSQATLNKQGVVVGGAGEFLGYNLLSVGVWALGLGLVYAGLRDLRRSGKGGAP